MQNVFAAVAVVHVKVNQRHALQAMVLQRMHNTHRHVVEKAEAHGAVALGMVAGRAHAAKGGGHATGNHQIRGLHQGACGAQGSHGGVGVHAGVGVNPEVAFIGGGVQDAVHIVRPMGAGQLGLGRQRGVVAAHVVQQALGQQHVVDGAQAFRAFGVVGTHFVAAAVGVRDVGG